MSACMQETNALFIHVNYSKIGYSYIHSYTIDVRLIDQWIVTSYVPSKNRYGVNIQNLCRAKIYLEEDC